jgi:hypothetical protein
MGLRGRLEEQAGRVEKTFHGFRALIAEGGDVLSVEAYLVTLVRAVRRDEADEGQSRREIYATARKRRRRLGLICLSAGPMASVANQVADLYCETATVTDIAHLHHLRLGDAEIAARMLMLWSVVDDLDQAEGAIRSDPPVAALLAKGFVAAPDDGWTNLSIAKALWKIRDFDLRGADAGKSGGQPIRSVAFTGNRTKKLIKRAEEQLGITTESLGSAASR